MGRSGFVGTSDGRREHLLKVRRAVAALFGLCHLSVEWSGARCLIADRVLWRAQEYRLNVGLIECLGVSGRDVRRCRIRSTEPRLDFSIMHWRRTVHSWH